MNAVVNAVRDLRLVRFCQLSASFVAIYDHLITIDQEYELIWQRQWTLSKVMFLINRYVGAALLCTEAAVLLNEGHMSDKVGCLYFFFAQGWVGVTVCLASQNIMRMRVVAMYGNSARVASFLSVCYIAEAIAISTILGLVCARMSAVDEPIPGIRICTPVMIPRFFFSFWLPICAFESILFAFALWKGLSFFFSSGEKWTGGTLTYVLFRDSISYFFLILMACVTNAVVWLTLPSTWLEVPEGYVTATYCIMGSRLMLNMRDAYYLPVSQGMSSVSTMSFASNGVGRQLHRGGATSTTFVDSHCNSDIEMHPVVRLGNDSVVATRVSPGKDGITLM
ncbi:hypothetical protein JAAARDRAFT_34546 [Jaapia argillacea MUCL 33604]|uniref:DUF6533 domain-containing protein n=1 Tax=Jaapia argillacea MUCL 33604 TaxID=933084 RepID=A0A067PXT9_9AGAM|nr:hypothetical protein JAAARDRAFT_34546 [Jaapia argillacea MUCL 33604]